MDDSNSLFISNKVQIPLHEIELNAIRAQGSGGQNVNKVATAIHLRFDIRDSSLPEFYQQRLLALQDQRLTQDGIIVIKAQSFRTQEQNREDALLRLQKMIQGAAKTEKKRKPTKPSKAAKRRRLDKKKQQGQKKQLRGKIL